MLNYFYLFLLFNFFHSLIGRDFQKETGIRQYPFILINQLHHQDEQIEFGKFIFALKKASEMKRDNNYQWTEAFDTACEQLQTIHDNKSNQCQELVFTAADHYEFKRLWQERHNATGVFDANREKIGGSLLYFLKIAEATGKLKRTFDILKNNKDNSMVVLADGGKYFNATQKENGTFILKESGNKNIRESGNNNICYVNDNQETEIGFKRYSLKTPSNKTIIVSTAAAIAPAFVSDEFSESPLKQGFLFLLAAASTYFGWGCPEVVTPTTAIVHNTATIALLSLRLSPVVQKLIGEYNKPCPLNEMEEKLKNNLRKEKQRNQNQKKEQEENFKKAQEEQLAFLANLTKNKNTHPEPQK